MRRKCHPWPRKDFAVSISLGIDPRHYRRGMTDSPSDRNASESFVPSGFAPPESISGDGFRLEPLGPKHNERDYAAWMSCVEFIHTMPGFESSDWPSPMTLEENLGDLEAHAKDFADQTGFTYSILDGDDVIGCLYIYPTTEPGHDADVKSWVTKGRASTDASVRKAIADWIRAEWPFTDPYIP